jgi:hypothetical protein
MFTIDGVGCTTTFKNNISSKWSGLYSMRFKKEMGKKGICVAVKAFIFAHDEYFYTIVHTTNYCLTEN